MCFLVIGIIKKKNHKQEFKWAFAISSIPNALKDCSSLLGKHLLFKDTNLTNSINIFFNYVAVNRNF